MKLRLRFLWTGCAALLLAGCATAPAPPGVPISHEALAGSWNLTRVGAQRVSRAISLNFGRDGTVSGTVRCNGWSGRYEILPPTFVFTDSPIITAAGCGDWPANADLVARAERTLFNAGSAYLSADGRRLYVRGAETLRFVRTS